MDKYEYRIKAEQIRKLAEQEDFASAVKIADTIDWNRVRSIPMLCLVGEIYEKNNMLEESRDVMLIAYDRHPYGRMIIYSLAELSIRLEDYIDAVEYYKEFVQVAPRDTGRYILQYKLYEAQHVGIQERIAVLEEFKKHEYIEKWAFELAYLYHRAGMKEKCIAECDEMIVWFSEGKYVEKAMELKMLYEPLSEEQQKKYDNRNDIEIEKSIADVEAVLEKDKKEDEIQIKPLNYGIYDTVNLQNELARSMEKILNVTEQENVNQVEMKPQIPVETIDTPVEDEESGLKDTALMQEAASLLNKITSVSDKMEKDDTTKIMPSKEIMDAIVAVHEEFNQRDEESENEDTEQITSAVSEKDILTKQLTSQLSIEEVLQEWEKIKKETADKEERTEKVSFEEETGTDLEVEGELETEPHELSLEESEIELEEVEDDQNVEDEGYYDDEVVKALESIQSQSKAEQENIFEEDEDRDTLAALKAMSMETKGEEQETKEPFTPEVSHEDEKNEEEVEELEFESEDETEEMFAALDQMLEPADIFYNEEDREKIEEIRRIREEELLQAEAEEIDEELYENLRGVTGASKYGDRQEESLSDEIYAALKELKEGKKELVEEEAGEESAEEENQEEFVEEAEEEYVEEETEEESVEEEAEEEFVEEEAEEEFVEEETEEEELVEEETQEESQLNDEIYAALNQLQKFDNLEDQDDNSYESELYGDEETEKEQEEEETQEESVEEETEEEFVEEAEEDFGEDDQGTERFEDLADAIMREAQAALHAMNEEEPEHVKAENAERKENQYWSKPSLLYDETEPEFENIRMEEEQGEEAEYETVDPDELEKYQEQEVSYWSRGSQQDIRGEVEEPEEETIEEVEEPEEETIEEVEEPEEETVEEVEEPEEETQEEIKDAVGEIESEIQNSLPNGIGDIVGDEKEETEPFVLEENAESFKKVFKYFTEIDGVSEQILDAIDKMEEISDKGNVIIMGDAATGKTTLAVDIIKAAKRSKNITGNKVARITGEAMNTKSIQDVLDSSVGGVLIVEEAASMTAETVRKFSDGLESTEDKLLVILEDSRERMMLLLEMDNRFREKFPAVIDLPPYTNSDLVAFAHSYAAEIGCTIDEMGVLALYSKLAEMQYQSEVIPTLYHVKELIDGALEKAQKRKKSKSSFGSFFARKKEKTNEVVIQEKDFL